MCGISGELTFDGSDASLPALERMMNTLAPRGPDAGGAFAQDRLAFGHRRLRIIDLSARAQQPMVDPALGLSVVFNGCIYNYRELRKELEARGYRFFSDGDTEVLLKAYHAWGLDCPQRLQGMFAFAVYERDSGRLVLCRDRLGIKPLYLAERPGRRVRFASTLPALLAAGDLDTAIDPRALHHYLSFHAVVPPPETIVRGARKLPPATIAVFEPDGRRSEHRYWALEFSRSADDIAASPEQWRERIHGALRTAVDRRMVADVPVGVLLSGGVDSSLIVALLAQGGQRDLKTFSIGFEDAHGETGNEFEYSDLVAAHYDTDHHQLFISNRHLLERLPQAVASMAEPMASYDNIGFFLLSEAVSQQVRVVQSGQGADEVFGGYHWYPPLLDSNDAVRDYARVFCDRDHEEFSRVVTDDFAGPDYSGSFIAEHFARAGADSAVDKALRLDTTVMLVDDPVKRVDNMTMAWGLEARVPFLDHELVELAARIPPREKLRDGGKAVLKDVARRLLPPAVIDRPKGYFPVPALKYLDGAALELVADSLGSAAARERGVFRREYLDMLLDEPREHITPLRGSKLWQIAVLEMWLQTQGI